MEKEDVIAFLENKVAGIREDEPTAVNAIAAYDYVINDLLNED